MHRESECHAFCFSEHAFWRTFPFNMSTPPLKSSVLIRGICRVGVGTWWGQCHRCDDVTSGENPEVMVGSSRSCWKLYIKTILFLVIPRATCCHVWVSHKNDAIMMPLGVILFSLPFPWAIDTAAQVNEYGKEL